MSDDHDARVHLTVAPLIAAQALRDAADEVYGDERAKGPYPEPLSIASWLRARADQIEAGEVKS